MSIMLFGPGVMDVEKQNNNIGIISTGIKFLLSSHASKKSTSAKPIVIFYASLCFTRISSYAS